MHGDAELAEPARLMGEPARAAMLAALLDGRSLPAGELAAIAGVTAPTASAHLARLLDGGLVAERRLGRHRYYSLAGPRVAAAIEALQAIAPRREVVSYRQAKAAVRLAEARSCYDHLAGRVAIGLADALAAEGAVEALEAGAPGRLGRVDGELGRRFRLDELRAEGRRAIVRGCLDWTERRPHIAGRLGAHLLEVALDEGWVERMPEGRGLVVTASGRAVLPA